MCAQYINAGFVHASALSSSRPKLPFHCVGHRNRTNVIMVLLRVSPLAYDRLLSLVRLDLLPAHLQQQVREFVALPPALRAIDHATLIAISVATRNHTQDQDSDFSFPALARGAEAFVAAPTPKPPGYDKMMQDLEAQLAQKEYDRLIATPQPSSLFSKKRSRAQVFQDAAQREDWQQAKREITAVLNVLASMMACATAGWWACGYASPIKKVVVALLSALFIGCAEAFLYYRFFTRRRAELLPLRPKPRQAAAAAVEKRPELRRSVSASALPRYAPASTTSPLSGEAKPLGAAPRSYSRRSAPESHLRKQAIERARMQRQRIPLTRSVSL